MMDRIHCQQLTGKGTMALSFLPDDQHRPLMETETVALLPVLRRLEVIVGGSGAAQSLAGLRLLLEHLSHLQLQLQQPGLLGDEGEGAQTPLSEKIGKRLIEEGGIQILLTLLLSGTGNLENNPRPVKESSVRMRQLGLEVLCQLCLLNKDAPELLGKQTSFSSSASTSLSTHLCTRRPAR